MRVIVQRVSSARVRVDGRVVGEIGRGFLLLVGVGRDDPADDDRGNIEVERMADKIATLRVFADPEGKMNLALADVDGAVLVVSQFTLYGDVRKGRRPSFARAAEPQTAAERVEALATAFEARGIPTERGVFGADMQVDLLNDGPVTLAIDAADLGRSPTDPQP
jgi:D-tyrosyl-tRNA(Tyr) deacylase